MSSQPRSSAVPADGPPATGENTINVDGFGVAAFGDSVMWGQGLNRSDRFAWQVANQLAADEKKSVRMLADRSRSGAQISASRAERSRFRLTFPEMFRSRAERIRFINGDEGAATRLYGEIPATFPTVSWQVATVPAKTGREVEVALVSGGANDIGFDDVINPQKFPGAFIEEYDGQIRATCHDAILRLLGDVRSKCPNAVILLFGYQRVLSYQSSKARIKAWFKHEFDDDFKWWFNENVFTVVPVDQMVDEARIRCVWAHGRADHWMRQAVTEANSDDDLRGPGVLYVPSGQGPSESAFGVNSHTFQDYEHPASDPAETQRAQQCPRADRRRDLAALHAAIALSRVTGVSGHAAARKAAAALLKVIRGPETLLDALGDYISDPRDDGKRCMRELSSEISRIQRALIASLMHPNEKGAALYTRIAVARYRAHQQAMQTIERDERPTNAPPVSVPGGPETSSELLTRFGLRGSGTLRRDIHHLSVDVLTLIVVTERESDQHLAQDMTLVVERKDGARPLNVREYQLNFPYRIVSTGVGQFGVKKFYPHFEPAQTNRFCLPTDADLRLADVSGFAITMGPKPNLPNARLGTVWRPRRISLEINGRVVHDVTFRSRELRPNETLRLEYPPRRNATAGPVLASSE